MCLVICGLFPGWRDKVTSVSQQKMTLFFSHRSSSSFVALNTTSVGSVFVRTKNDVWLVASPFQDGGIKSLLWVSKRWPSSFQVDHHHLSSRWMRPQLPRFLSAPKLVMCLVLFGSFPEWTIKVTVVRQQKMTLFFSSRSSSSFVALNATSVA